MRALLALTAFAAVAFTAAPASADVRRDCGDPAIFEVSTTRNVTTDDITCKRAVRFIDAWYWRGCGAKRASCTQALPGSGGRIKLRCRGKKIGGGFWRERCTGSGIAIRFENLAPS